MATVDDDQEYAPQLTSWDWIEWALRSVPQRNERPLRVLMALIRYANKGGFCWPSQATLARTAFGVVDVTPSHVKQIARGMQDLVARGLVEVESSPRGNRYRLQFQTPAEPAGPAVAAGPAEPFTQTPVEPSSDPRWVGPQTPAEPAGLTAREEPEEAAKRSTATGGAAASARQVTSNDHEVHPLLAAYVEPETYSVYEGNCEDCGKRFGVGGLIRFKRKSPTGCWGTCTVCYDRRTEQAADDLRAQRIVVPLSIDDVDLITTEQTEEEQQRTKDLTAWYQARLKPTSDPSVDRLAEMRARVLSQGASA